jgi:hypothetical protein
MSGVTRVPWEFSTPPANDAEAVPNLPTPEGRALGAELARIADLEEEHQREKFPNAKPRCADCAFRAGSIPNGCPETLMDAVKALAECTPFYCHHGLDSAQPTRLCAGYALLMGVTARRDDGDEQESSRTVGQEDR